MVYVLKNFTVNYWIEKGANSRKIVLGVPLYGQSFTLSNPKVHGLNAPSSGAGEAGQFTRSAGFIAYYEVNIKLFIALIAYMPIHFYRIFWVYRFVKSFRLNNGQL